MGLKSKNKVNALFQMSSLTDIIFLLLIFFLLTSTFVAPNAINLKLPNATGQTVSNQSVRLSITENLEYYIDKKKIGQGQIGNELRKATSNVSGKTPTVVLNADKSVALEYIVDVLKLGNEMGIQIILATQPE